MYGDQRSIYPNDHIDKDSTPTNRMKLILYQVGC